MNQHWEPDGTARGRVVLLHGMMSTASTWWRAGPALAARGWVVDALDLPGHGDSPRSAGPLDLDTLVDGTAGRLGGPVDLLAGHSLGAAVALALAGRHPRAARALVAEDPPSRSHPDHAAILAAGIEADARLAGHDRWDLPAMVAAVPVPLLVLAARPGDGFVGHGGSALQGPDREAVRAQLPPDRFVVLDGGHCLHRDHPARWVEMVSGFADAVLAAPWLIRPGAPAPRAPPGPRCDDAGHRSRWKGIPWPRAPRRRRGSQTCCGSRPARST
jgi:pimeloyl-ACP methyl ester carboxylesterase